MCCHLCFFIVLAHLMKSSLSVAISAGLSALASVYILKMVEAVMLWTSLAICWESSWHVWVARVFTVYEGFSSGWFWSCQMYYLLFFCSPFFMASGSSLSYFGFHEHFLCSLHFNPVAQANTWSQVHCLFFWLQLILVWFLQSLFMPCFSLLSFSLYSHSFALIQRWPIHSSAFTLWCPVSFQYCNDNIVSL